MQMNPKDLILHLFKNERKRKVLIELHEGRKSFTELKEEQEPVTTPIMN
jgi:DNA-binding HxlR family transcriptional regulator